MSALRMLAAIALSFHAAPSWVAEAKAPSQATIDLKLLQDWIPRLAGKFRLEGSLEVAGDSGPAERLSVRGQADCRGIRDSDRMFVQASGVECSLEMTWTPSSAAGSNAPEPAATKHSATLLYAIDRSVPGILHLLVDDEGVAEGGTARMQSDMLISESPCARIKGKCLRKVHITEPNRQSLKLEVDMELDGKRIGGQQLTLHRETVSP